MKGIKFLQNMSACNACLCGDPETDGCAHHMWLMGETAKEMLEELRENPNKYGDDKQIIREWSDRAQKAWRESKFFKLWQEVKARNGNIDEEFKARGWEP